MLVFFLMMTLHPDVGRRAQRELDEVVGSGRLPQFSDRDSLPYISAIIRECLRLFPVAPIGIPHRAVEDDVYKDQYFIPKGSIVIGNVWYVIITLYIDHSPLCVQRAIMRDPKVYPYPDEFRPDRFLTPDGQLDPSIKDTELAVFGFGRRFESVFCDMIDADAMARTFLLEYVQGGILLLTHSSSTWPPCCTYMILVRR